MDRIDFEIIRHLQNDGRISNKTLAAEVGLAPSTCFERVKQLNKRVFDFVMQNGTSESPFCTQSSTAYYCPGRPGLQHYAITSQARYC
ncbi:MAG: AsnC family protein, partial [Candidatus Sedimenticola sp. (ex Thyasira tokunagai)]